MTALDFRDLPAPPQFIVPRDGKQRPMVVPPQGGKPEAYTRTTTYIDVIEDKSNLADWGKRMVLRGVRNKPELLDELRAIDPYGTRAADRSDPKFRDQVDEIVEKALAAAGAHDKREKGTDLHGLSELVDQGLPMPDSASVADRLDMAAYLLAVSNFGLTFSHIEQFVVVPELRVGGTPDRICGFEPGAEERIVFPEGASPEDDFIFDLKTGTVEYGGLKMCAQEAAYSRAQFYNPLVFPAPRYAPSVTKAKDADGFEAHKAWKAWCATEFDPELAATAYSPIPPVNQKWGLILNLPSGTSEATLHWADLEIGWEAAELAGVVRKMRSLSSKALMAAAHPA